QGYLHRYSTGQPIVWSEILVRALTDWCVWAALTPVILALAGSFPFEQATWRKSLAVHGLASVLAGLVVATSLTFALHVGGGESFRSAPFLDTLRVFLFAPFIIFYLWIYWGIVGVSQAWSYYHKYRERELQASRLAAQLAQAQLQVLKMQLHPHFLFNTLHTISALMHKDVQLAERMVARLGELLRSTLENAGTQEVALRHELEFIQPYLEIEQ